MILKEWHKKTGFIAHESMTAIIRTFTHDGFVIGADGRRTNDDGSIEDCAQKIFPMASISVSLACSIAGITILGDEASQDAINLIPLIINSGDLLRSVATSDIHEYASKLEKFVEGDKFTARDLGFAFADGGGLGFGRPVGRLQSRDRNRPGRRLEL